MDAMRLIDANRHALAQAGTEQDVVVEAWQAHALAEAIGGHLTLHGPPEARTEASGLCEAAGRARGALHHPALRHPVVRGGGIRAVQLTEVRDLRRALPALAELLGDAGIALVQVASGTEEEALYWQCVESMDAADECRDRVRGILRHLEVRERGGAA
ncbi:DUF6099 family protein [Streptomyces palmae]|uniref:Uncharacterized protein n=1 Tax=Streptomyces palmae TaxID=1701085 RepID=A0A4Z0H762_9ACTN|nr:DUF6099 family protein [Streptomyces palmae]TGB06038.1 hypothetical protein E4099_18640 [Streptomyces palmae]